MERTTVRRTRAVFQARRFRSLSAVGLASATLGCSDAQTATPSAPTPDTPFSSQASQAGAQEGQFVSYIADFEDGHSERSYGLRLSDGRELPLAFDSPPAMVTGTRVRVRGDMVSESLRVSTFEQLSAADTVQSANPVTWPLAASETFALVLVDVGSGLGSVTAATAQTTMFSTNLADKSFASFYYESSYGKYNVTGDVLGPYTYSMTTCNTTGMYQAIEPQITKSYNHLIYYFGKSSLCTFGGLGEEGSVTNPAKRTWMNGSLGCVVLMQEPGHNFGLMHANTMTCPGASFSATPATSCTIAEYGSSWTPMGSGCHQLNGYEKWYEQWLSGCNGVRVTSSGTFSLAPLGQSCPGAVQVLQIPMPATRTVSDPQATSTTVNLKDYYVELRAPAGTFDQYSTGGRGGGFTQPTVTVYASDDVHPGTSTGRGGGGNSVWTELLNMNPSASTTTFAGLQVGVPFSDPSGSPTITLQSVSATGAIVNVTVQNGTGGPTCIDGTTLTGAGPACDGGAVTIPPSEAGAAEGGTSDAGALEASAGTSDAGQAGTTTADAQAGAGDAGAQGAGSSGGPGSAVDAGGPPPGSGAGWSTPDADTAAAWAREAAQPTGCGCESVGAAHRGPRGAWVGLGALALLGWRAQQKRRRRAAGARVSHDE